MLMIVATNTSTNEIRTDRVRTNSNVVVRTDNLGGREAMMAEDGLHEAYGLEFPWVRR